MTGCRRCWIEAAATAATLTALGYLDVTVRTVTVVATGAGPEADARTARHRALDEVAAPVLG